jgi:hypothetical protein
VFSWSICEENCHIITCIKSDSFKGYVGIHESRENNIIMTERDHHTLRRIFSQNHRTTAALVTAEPNIHLEGPVSTKTV